MDLRMGKNISFEYVRSFYAPPCHSNYSFNYMLHNAYSEAHKKGRIKR